MNDQCPTQAKLHCSKRSRLRHPIIYTVALEPCCQPVRVAAADERLSGLEPGSPASVTLIGPLPASWGSNDATSVDDRSDCLSACERDAFERALVMDV